MEKRSRHEVKEKDRYIRPSKAEAMLKKAHNNHQTVYIYGTAGYGKTALITDFLARKSYEYYSAGNENFWIEVPTGIDNKTKERIIVFDDLHRLTDEDMRSTFKDLLEKLLSHSKIWLILIARCPLPSWLKSLYIEKDFMIIDENLLSLTEAEAENYLESWSLQVFPEILKRVLEAGKGCPLALRILAMRLLSGKSGVILDKGTAIQEIERGQSDLLDYFEQTVFDHWPLILQEFLTELSVVEVFDQELALFITRKRDVNRLIREALEIDNLFETFIHHDRLFLKMRPLLKALIQYRIKKDGLQNGIKERCDRAGAYYEMQGYFEEALKMYEKSGNESCMAELLIEMTRQYAGADQYWKYRHFYLRLSEERKLQSPELMAGMSMVHSILLDDDESERWAESLKHFKAVHGGHQRKNAEERLLYLDLALPHRGIIKMTERLQEILRLNQIREIDLHEISITNQEPSVMHGGKDFCEWSRIGEEQVERFEALAEKVFKKWGKGLVNIALAEGLFEKGTDDDRVSELANRGRLQAEGDGKTELVFVAVGLLAQQDLLDGRIEEALERLDSFKEKAVSRAGELLPGIETLIARLYLYIDKRNGLEEWLSQAPDENIEFCTMERYRYITKVRVYLAMGKRKKALNLLQLLLPYSEKRQRIYLYLEAKVLLAVTQYRLKVPRWRETLQEAVQMASDYHFVRILTREGKALWSLLQSTELIWPDDRFKKQVLSECQQMAELYPGYLNEKQTGQILLSQKALKVLKLQAENMSIEEIAAVMGLSKAGVKYYNRENYRKLGVNNKTAAVVEAKNRGIL